MAYNKEALYKQAIEILDSNKDIMFIEHLVSLMPCDKTTLYKWLPIESNEFNALKEKIELNKIDRKSKMYKKWFDSDHPTLQVALMKLIATEDEAHRLNGSSQKLDATNKNTIEYVNVSKQFPKEK